MSSASPEEQWLEDLFRSWPMRLALFTLDAVLWAADRVSGAARRLEERARALR